MKILSISILALCFWSELSQAQEAVQSQLDSLKKIVAIQQAQIASLKEPPRFIKDTFQEYSRRTSANNVPDGNGKYRPFAELEIPPGTWDVSGVAFMSGGNWNSNRSEDLRAQDLKSYSICISEKKDSCSRDSGLGFDDVINKPGRFFDLTLWTISTAPSRVSFTSPTKLYLLLTANAASMGWASSKGDSYLEAREIK